MGWTQTRDHVERTKAAVLAYHYGDTQDGFTYRKPWYTGGEQVTEVAAAALVGHAFYAVMRFRNPQQPEFGPWFGSVDRVAFTREGFGYKDMTEEMGPREATAPLHVLETLDRLAPHPPLSADVQAEIAALLAQQGSARGQAYLDLGARLHALDPHRFARAWRSACRAHQEQQAQVRRVKPGMRLRFRTPLRFQSGAVRDTFRLVDCGGGRRLFQGDDGGYYQLRGWTALAFEVLAE